MASLVSRTRVMISVAVACAAVGIVPAAADQPRPTPPPPGSPPPTAGAPAVPGQGTTVVEETGDSSRWRVEGQLGLGMPLGGAGIEVTSFVARGLSISGGVGKSIQGPVQVGLMPRLSVIRLMDTIHLAVGVGLSYGDYDQVDFLFLSSGGYYPNTLWGNVELSLLVTAGGVGLRAFSGFSQILSYGTEDGDDSTPTSEMPYLGLGLSLTL